MNFVYFATTNSGKFRSLEECMSGLSDWRVIQVPFIEKARFARRVVEKSDGGVLVLDSGFFIEALGGFPGALVDPVILKNPKMGVPKLLNLMEGEKMRRCFFQECLAFIDLRLAKEPLLFFSKRPGHLTYEPRGRYIRGFHWSELSTVFVPEGRRATLAEMPEEVYRGWSIIVDRRSSHP